MRVQVKGEENNWNKENSCCPPRRGGKGMCFYS